MILKDVLEQYKNKRNRAQLIVEKNKNTALKNEQFFQLEKRFRELNIEYAKNALSKTLSELKKVQDDKERLLADLKLDLTPKYECNVCQDTGYIKGKLCLCIRRELSNRVADICGVQKNIQCDFDKCDLSIFTDEQQREQMKVVYQKMQEYCDKFLTTPINTIIFSGPTGTGKTYLISAIASELTMSGIDVFYTTAFGLTNMFLKSHMASIEEKSQYIEPLINCDLLVIDDLGTEPIYRNVSIEYLFNIINERKINKKHLIVSTNLTLDEIINRYGERIFSRLNNKADSLFLYLEGKDIRLNTKQ